MTGDDVPTPRPVTRRRRSHAGFAVIAWIATTVVAMSVIWIGISAATRTIIGAPLPSLGVDNVADLAANPSSTTASLPTSRSTSTSTTTPTSSTTVVPPATSVAPTTTTTAGTHTRSTTTTTPYRSTTHPRRAITAPFANKGGLITVTCTGAAITLDSTIPADGYALDVAENGPRRIVVRFLADGDVVPIAVVCSHGRPVVQPRPPDSPPPPPPTSNPGRAPQ